MIPSHSVAIDLSEILSLQFAIFFPLLQEKQMIKVKEKLDKCNKEKLSEFCDVLDIPIAKATTRKVR